MRKTSVALLAALCAVACEAPDSRPATTVREAPLCETTLSQIDAVTVETPRALNTRFGASIAATPEWAVIGAPGAQAAWVYACDAVDGCAVHQQLVSPDAQPDDETGRAVAISADTIAIGAADGRVDIWRLNAERWEYDTTLDGTADDGPVTSLALAGDLLAVGYGQAIPLGQGAVQLYSAAPSWAPVERLTDANYPGFGTAVAIFAGSVYIGAPGDESIAGVVVEYSFLATAWSQVNLFDELSSPGDLVGSSIAVNQDCVYAGAPGEDGGATDSGAVVRYERDTTAAFSRIGPETPQEGLRFGSAVAASADFLAIAAIDSNEFGPGAGAVSVFDIDTETLVNRPDPVWAPNTEGIGSAVAFVDGYLLAGISGDDLDGDDVGSVFVMQSDADEDGTPDFEQIQRLRNPNGLGGLSLGKGGLSATSDRILTGSTKFSRAGERSGAAFTFVREGDGWTPEATLIPEALVRDSQAGEAALLLDDIALVGAPGHPVEGIEQAGRVFVFQVGGTWDETAAIDSPDPQPNAWFGGAIDGDAERIVIGERWGGSAYVFATRTWALQATIDGIGSAVDLRGDLLLGGLEFGAQGGSATLFRETTPGTWTVVSELVPPEPVEGFGAAVALGEGVAFVYAPAATAAEADQYYGVVHQFVDDGERYKHVRVLQAETPNYKAFFGYEIALNGDLLAVSAKGDTRNAESVGAVYVLGRDAHGANRWGVVRRIVDDPPSEFFGFGHSVGWAGAELIVGVPFVDGVAAGAGRFDVLNSAATTAPTATDDEVTVPRDVDYVEFDVLGNDSDPDGDELFVIVDGPPARGDVSLQASGSVKYFPGEDFAGGSDSFSYVVSDCQTVSTPATVTLIGEAASCDAQTSCPDGEVCVGTTCFDACEANEECGNGESCFADHCAVTACDGVVCPASEVCYAGGCFATCVDEMCSQGVCFDGRCADEACQDVVCPAGEMCVGGSCFASCAGEDDCAAELACFEGRCTSEPCEGIQCQTGEVCIEGGCFPGAQCTQDAECRPGQECIDGVCTSPPREGCCRTTGEPRREAPLFLLIGLLLLARSRRRETSRRM